MGIWCAVRWTSLLLATSRGGFCGDDKNRTQRVLRADENGGSLRRRRATLLGLDTKEIRNADPANQTAILNLNYGRVKSVCVPGPAGLVREGRQQRSPRVHTYAVASCRE